MFTGLIQEIGHIDWIRRHSAGLEYQVRCNEVHLGLKTGASISVNGICQSVCQLLPCGFKAIAGDATFGKTTISSWSLGRAVHLEKALSLGDSMDGHLVQGHVGETSMLLRSYEKDGTRILRFKALSKPVEQEESIAIDGVSLTVSSIHREWFEVNILPDTWNKTHFSEKKKGAMMNVEMDCLRARSIGAAQSDLTMEKMIRWGYL